MKIKKEILTALGSNLSLCDKILLFEAKKFVFIVATGLNRSASNSAPFEPQYFITPQRKDALPSISGTAWCGIVDEARTYYRDAEDFFHIPDFSEHEEIEEAA